MPKAGSRTSSPGMSGTVAAAEQHHDFADAHACSATTVPWILIW